MALPPASHIKVTDEKGIDIEVIPKGDKRWRFKYRFGGKEKLLSLGVYPDISLKEARNRRDDHRRLVAEGIDPSVVRKAEKEATSNKNSFEAVTREWHKKHNTCPQIWLTLCAVSNTPLSSILLSIANN